MFSRLIFYILSKWGLNKVFFRIFLSLESFKKSNSRRFYTFLFLVAKVSKMIFLNEKETKVHENVLVDYQGILFVNVTKIQKKWICSIEILKVIKIVFMFLFILLLSVRPYVSRNFEIGTCHQHRLFILLWWVRPWIAFMRCLKSTS